MKVALIFLFFIAAYANAYRVTQLVQVRGLDLFGRGSGEAIVDPISYSLFGVPGVLDVGATASAQGGFHFGEQSNSHKHHHH